MKKHVSELMGLNITSHSQIEFVDVLLEPDVKLFIDPCLIDIHNDKWSVNAKTTIDSYFNKFYELYRTKQSDQSKLSLFAHAHEINATKLGYGNGQNGKAKTPDGMLETFTQIDNLFSKQINLSHAIDLPLFIHDFAEDCLSDMLTNILFKVLNDFTLDQCRKYSITPTMAPRTYHYWDCHVNDWLPYKGDCLVLENKLILLVPKWFVRKNFYYNTSQYFSRVILEKIQQEKAWIDADGKEVKPSKESLEKEIIFVNKDKLIAAIDYTEKDPSLLTGYHSRMPKEYANRNMNDEMLDNILYGPEMI